MNQQERTVGML